MADDIILKVAILGAPGVGKTTIISKLVDNVIPAGYYQTLGINLMEKTCYIIASNKKNAILKNAEDTDITPAEPAPNSKKKIKLRLSFWELGGDKEFARMLPIVCNGAAVIIYAFDLSRPQTMEEIRGLYKSARNFKQKAIPILVGTKYDAFYNPDGVSDTDRIVINRARKYAVALKSHLIFTSAKYNINLKSLVNIIVYSIFDFDLGRKVKEKVDNDSPILELNHKRGTT